MSGTGRVRLSVCMATYNGQEYVTEQVESILAQLSAADELVIVDDASKDSTLQVLRRIEDPRIVLLPNPSNKGYVASFERAITASRGDYVMLSDQDDVWLDGRVETLIAALQKKNFAASNFTVFGGPPNRYHEVQLKESDSGRWVANLLTTWIGIRPYYGCTMAFTSRAKKQILPFPEFLIETHDQWIAMVGNLNQDMVHVAAPTVARRLHDDNTTPKSRRPVKVILQARVMLLRAFFVALGRKAGSR